MEEPVGVIKVPPLKLTVVLCKRLEADEVEEHRGSRRVVSAVVEGRHLSVANKRAISFHEKFQAVLVQSTYKNTRGKEQG